MKALLKTSTKNILKSIILISSCYIASSYAGPEKPCADAFYASTNNSGGYGGYKATSTGGFTYYGLTSTWLGDGKYAVSMKINPTQGIKYWYFSTNKTSWVTMPSNDSQNAYGGVIATGCLSGLVVSAKPANNVAVGSGTGVATITPGPMGGTKNGLFVLYDERVDGFITMSQVGMGRTYAAGNSKEDIVPRNLSFTVDITDLKNVPNGVYVVSITIPVGATTTWFPANVQYDNWWLAPSTVPLNSAVSIPITVRSDNNVPTNPVITCSMPSSLSFNHGTIQAQNVNGSVLEEKIPIQCNASTSGSIEITASDNGLSNYASVILGNGVTSQLSVTSDGTTWSRKITSFPLNNGTTTLQLRSVLSTTGKVVAGSLSGSAIATIKYN